MRTTFAWDPELVPTQSNPMKLEPYRVRYLSRESNGYEFCCYAYNKPHARLQAIEMVQAIQDNPDCIQFILREDTDFDW